MKKSAIAIFAATILLLSTVTMLYAPGVIASPGPDNATIQGVLSSDYYTLYPYETTSIDIGISKYGEMIDGSGVLPDVGIQYPGYEEVETHDQRLAGDLSRDPFANEEVDKKLWLNGWFMDVRYTHTQHGDRHFSAMAMSADMSVFGGDWLTGHDPDFTQSPYGGRKTTGYAETEDLEVLYDGPRRYIAICKTTLYDWKDIDGDEVVDHPDETWDILDFRVTFIFNKVKKYVTILKDLKILMISKELKSPVDVQLSNREEWDLGEEPDFESYIHFYHQQNGTCYGYTEDFSEYGSTSEVHLADGIMKEFEYEEVILATPQTIYVPGNLNPNYDYPIVDGSVRAYIDYDDDDPDMGWVFLEPGDDYTIDLNDGEITWLDVDPKEDDEVKVFYKLWKHIDEYGYPVEIAPDLYEPSGVPHLYDVAQVISDDAKVVGFKAFWPTLSDYDVDGWGRAYEPLIDVERADMDEPEIPFTIGEWDFMLGGDYPDQFRGVEVVGLVAYHDADDADANDLNENGVDENLMDSEVVYQLEEVFNPWDLLSAVHKKDTSRWVEFFEYDEDFEDDMDTMLADDVQWIELDKDYPWTSGWRDYCTFAERVLVDGVLITPIDVIWWEDGDTYMMSDIEPVKSTWLSYPYTYEIVSDNEIWFYEWDEEDDDWIAWDLEDGAMVKVLYSIDEPYVTGYPDASAWQPGRYEWIEVGRDAASVDSIGSALVSAAFKQKWMDIGITGIDMYDPVLANQIPWVMAKLDSGDTFEAYRDDLKRAALKDDWCTNWPISSSNMIFIGGPEAAVNLGAYYFNDFTDAFSDFTGEFTEPYDSPYEGMIAGITCWNRGWDGEWNTYESDEDMGYAVISTYKDLNGTVGLVIYGHWGRDTYYATQWLHGNAASEIKPGIVQLQEAPECLTSIIIEIDYDDPEHPEFEIVECLGTITEFDWEHDYWDYFEADTEDEDKGGLHDP
jgi:hypothetical protein